MAGLHVADRVITDPTRKAKAIEAYQHNVATIPCKHYNYGKGECPFGSSCFYAHLNPVRDSSSATHSPPKGRRLALAHCLLVMDQDGSLADDPVLRTSIGADGKVDVIKARRTHTLHTYSCLTTNPNK